MSITKLCQVRLYDYPMFGIINHSTIRNGKHTERYANTARHLASLLPHGSGINGNWDIYQSKRAANIWYAENWFEAMNENGYYCHDYSFSAKYRYNGLEAFEACEICNGAGIRYTNDLYAINPNWPVSEYQVYTDTITYQDYILCNVCKGSGKHTLPVFSLLKINFHGNRLNRACCGYALDDYLYQALDLS